MMHRKIKRSTASKLFVLLLVFALMLSLAGCGGTSATTTTDSASSSNNSSSSNSTAAQKPIELRLAHMWPANHLVETELVQGWSKAVETATNGRVKITSYPAQTLISGPETYEGIVQDVADIGLGVYAYTRGRFPVIETFLLPGISFNDSKAGSLALMDGIKTLNPKELQDTHQIFSWTAGTGYIMSKTPIKQLSDMKGLDLGVSAGPRADAFKLLGANPVDLPMPDWYEALQKGVMKGGIAPLETLQGFKLGEVTGNYLTKAPFLYNQAFFMVMNLDKWNSIPADVQQQITDASEKYYSENVPGLFDKINENGLKATQANKNVQMIDLSDTERAKWLETIKPVEDQYIADLNSKGLDGQKIFDTVQGLADKYNNQ